MFRKSQVWSTYAGTCTIYTNACGAVPAITWTGTWGTWGTFASKATNASNTGIQIGRDHYLYYMRATNSKPYIRVSYRTTDNGGTIHWYYRSCDVDVNNSSYIQHGATYGTSGYDYGTEG